MRKLTCLAFISLLLLFVLGCSQNAANPPAGEAKSQEKTITDSGTQSSDAEAVEDDSPDTEESADDSSEGEDDESSAESDSEEDDDFGEFEEEFKESDKEVFDPLSGYNRAITVFNDKLFLWVLDPVARGYRYVMPEPARRGVNNFFMNLLYPIRLVNNLLQLKIKNAGEETLRFVTNSTIGILGFWDPAKEWFGLEAHHEDFGQTLGYYGVGGGRRWGKI